MFFKLLRILCLFFAGHKIQKLPSRSMSLKSLDPRKLQKTIEKYREKRSSISSDTSSLPEDDDEASVDCLDFPHISMRKHGPLYVSLNFFYND